MPVALNSETLNVFQFVIDKTFEQAGKDPEFSIVRRDVLNRIRQKWAISLQQPSSYDSQNRNLEDSKPLSAANRAKYMKLPGSVDLLPVVPVADTVAENDEYEDEFSDEDFVPAIEMPTLEPAVVPVRIVPRRVVAMPSPRELVNVEELIPSLLEDVEYDAIPEIGDICIFGQTEVCESIVGPRRHDSRWMVTVMNGFVVGEEILFRTAKMSMGHLHHHGHHS